MSIKETATTPTPPAPLGLDAANVTVGTSATLKPVPTVVSDTVTDAYHSGEVKRVEVASKDLADLFTREARRYARSLEGIGVRIVRVSETVLHLVARDIKPRKPRQTS